MSTQGYKAGKFIGQNAGKLCLAATAIAGGYGFFTYLNNPTPAPQATAVPTASATAAKPDPCQTGQQARHHEAEKLFKAKKYDESADLLYACINTLSPNARALYVKASTTGDAARAKAAADQARAVKAEKKRQGVRVGMSMQDVLDSSWGRPEKVNRTTTQHGVREQWVYHGNYLYFVDGVLTTIQN